VGYARKVVTAVIAAGVLECGGSTPPFDECDLLVI
jgi:hypothetical protein